MEFGCHLFKEDMVRLAECFDLIETLDKLDLELLIFHETSAVKIYGLSSLRGWFFVVEIVNKYEWDCKWEGRLDTSRNIMTSRPLWDLDKVMNTSEFLWASDNAKNLII